MYSLRQQLNLAEHCQAKLQVHRHAVVYNSGCHDDITLLFGIQERLKTMRAPARRWQQLKKRQSWQRQPDSKPPQPDRSWSR